MKVVLSFTLTFYLTKSILLMIKRQIDMTELCWSANITSFSDLINYFWNEHLIKERWRSQCPSTMLFSTEHTHEHATEHATSTLFQSNDNIVHLWDTMQIPHLKISYISYLMLIVLLLISSWYQNLNENTEYSHWFALIHCSSLKYFHVIR